MEGLNAFKKPNVANKPKEAPAQQSQPRRPPSGGRVGSRAGLSDTVVGMPFPSSCWVRLGDWVPDSDIVVTVLRFYMSLKKVQLAVPELDI